MANKNCKHIRSILKLVQNLVRKAIFKLDAGLNRFAVPCTRSTMSTSSSEEEDFSKYAAVAVTGNDVQDAAHQSRIVSAADVPSNA